MRLFLFTLMVFAASAWADEPKPLHKSLAELEKYDPAEADEPGVKRLKEIRQARVSYKNPAQPDWSCKLSATEIALCDPLYAEFAVTNPSDRVAVHLPTPARGFLSSTVQVWVKAEGEKLFTSALGQRRAPTGSVPVRIDCGDTQRFTTRLDNYAYARLGQRKTGELQVDDAYWLGDITFRTPGKYEVVVRYLNLDSMQLTGEADQPDPDSVRLFGPFKLTVKDRPKNDPEWVADVREMWEMVRPKCHCVITHIRSDGLEPLHKLSLKEMRSVGPAGDDVFLWLQTHELHKLRYYKAEPLKPFVADLGEAVGKLPANHPNRAAAEFLEWAARLDRGEEAALLKRAKTSTNPDVKRLAAEWLTKVEEAKAKTKDE